MVTGEERRIPFGFPVNVPGGRLRCIGDARVRAPSDLARDVEASLGMKIAAALGRELGVAAARRQGHDDAIARAEAALRASPLAPGVDLVSVGTVELKDADGREVFARRPPASPVPASSTPAPGSAVMAFWQGQWYPARVVEVAGEQTKVQWEGATTLAWIPTPQLRPRS